MHHHASHLQAYLDEYSYRFNKSDMHEGIFRNLLYKMVASEPRPFKIIARS